MKKILSFLLAALTGLSLAPATLAEAARPALLAKEPNVTMPGELPVTTETTTLTIAVKSNANVIDYETNHFTLFLEEMGNVNLEIILFPETDDAYDKMNLMVASGSKLPDIILGLGVEKDDVRYAWGQAGALIPLQDYYDELGYYYDKSIETLQAVNPEITSEMLMSMNTSPDGNLYGMVSYRTSPVGELCHRGWINETWLETLGLEMPETTDEFTEMLRAFRDNDPNGNGIADEIPLIGSADSGAHGNVIRYLMNAFIYTELGDDFFLVGEDGTLDVAYDKEEWRDGLRYVHSLVEEGLLPRLSFTQTYQQYCAMMGADEMTVGVGVSLSCSSFGKNLVDYGVMTPLRGPGGAQWATFSPPTIDCVSAITVDCENPALAFRFLEMCYDNDDTMFTARYGEKDVDWAYPPEGTESIYKEMGYDAAFMQINDIWGVPQNKHWSNTSPCPTRVWGHIAFAVDTGIITNEVKNVQGVVRQRDYAPPLSQLVNKIVYTEEESGEFAEVRAVLQTYVKESMVRFVLGDMDIEKDWDSYLNELNRIGYKEYLAMNNTAFQRMNQ